MKCKWAYNSDLEMKYHDMEWCREVKDDIKLFEALCLEIMQAGLSFYTVLLKRENLRKAFDNFDYNIIENYNEIKINSLLNDKGIIRNEKKIKAIINNAKKFKDTQKKFGSFYNYIYSYSDKIINDVKSNQDLKSFDSLSIKISDDFKKFGFKFIGKTIIYSYIQAIGLIDDHLNSCDMKGKIK